MLCSRVHSAFHKPQGLGGWEDGEFNQVHGVVSRMSVVVKGPFSSSNGSKSSGNDSNNSVRFALASSELEFG